jgi:S1-C subfamily serine protease
MVRNIYLCSLALLGNWFLSAAHAEKPASKEALALQEALQAAIEEAEPAIACILVSRSEDYKEFNQAPSAEEPGKLGGFQIDYGKDFNLLRRDGKERRDLALKLDLARNDTVPEAFGSGVVIDVREALILTNYHVVRGATKLYVRLPGGKGSYANIHAADPRSDLAVLQLINKIPLKAIKLGDGGKARKGQMVLTIGNPYAAGYPDGSPSASWGIISNIRRRAPDKNRTELANRKPLHIYGTLLQTDARLNLGCSGGALIDLHGELIGLTTALAGITGGETPGGFAVPVDDTMRRIIDTLKGGKEVEYGFLGVSFRDPLVSQGVVVEYVFTGSPAEEARLYVGDVILSVNGTPVRRINDVFLPLAKLPPRARVRLEVRRLVGGVPRTIPVEAILAKYAVLGKIIAARRPEFRGLRVDYTSLLLQPPLAGQDPVARPGVLVCDIRSKSRADKPDLRPADVITRVNGRAVTTPGEFYRAVEGKNGPVELTLYGGKKVTIN